MASVIMSDAPSDIGPSSSRGGTPRARSVLRGSSARPRGPPSESNAQSDNEGEQGPADDQVPEENGRPRRKDRVVPRVVDNVGTKVQEAFEDFLQQ